MKLVLVTSLLMLSACVMHKVPDSKLPIHLETAIDTDLLILQTEDVRIVDVKEKKIAYEYNAQNVRLAQIGDHAKRFCDDKGRDTILVDMRFLTQDNLRRVTFECREKPVLIP